MRTARTSRSRWWRCSSSRSSRSTTDTFLTEFNLINILRNAALIGIVAVGMTYLLIAGEIDLSVGSVFGFLTVIMGLLVVVLGINPWLAHGRGDRARRA